VRPTRVLEVELSAPLADVPVPDHPAARVLVRLHGAPLGFLDLPVADGILRAADLAAAVDRELPLAAHLDADGVTGPTASPPAAGWPCGARGPHPLPGSVSVSVSVVLCTRDRAESLRIALTSLLGALRPGDEVVVVDNAPSNDDTRSVVAALRDPRLVYLLEPRPGVSVARNSGARAARAQVIAFTDDDVVVDPGWLEGLLRGFTRAPRVGCVTGLVPSAELDTAPQRFFDRKVQWSSSCVPRLFDLDGNRGPGALWPYQVGLVGTGASFAVRREAFDDLGGFDEALGAGALTRGGEDLDWFARTLLQGWTLAYEPSAIVWHRHRRDLDALTDQLYGYGTGLTAYLTKHALTWRGSRALARGLLRGGGKAPPAVAVDPGIDRALLRRERVGLLHGPLLYLRARLRLRRTRSPEVFAVGR
jgi:GT2 family glycosyltransferase